MAVWRGAAGPWMSHRLQASSCQAGCIASPMPMAFRPATSADFSGPRARTGRHDLTGGCPVESSASWSSIPGYRWKTSPVWPSRPIPLPGCACRCGPEVEKPARRGRRQTGCSSARPVWLKTRHLTSDAVGPWQRVCPAFGTGAGFGTDALPARAGSPRSDRTALCRTSFARCVAHTSANPPLGPPMVSVALNG